MTENTDINRGRSLTPASRSGEVIDAAWRDGLLGGLCALIPSSAAVWYFVKTSEKFRKSTNMQSRTAMIIMPPLFVFGFASERKMEHRMKEMASEYDHGANVSKWAEQEHQKNDTRNIAPVSKLEREKKLQEIYKKSVADSGVRIVPGNSLGVHHQIANFWQENPFKVLCAASVPSIIYIFKGRSEKSHLQLQSMIMHTRVFGQFTVIGLLLGIMGFKTYMDFEGKFITEAEAERRVEDMADARLQLLEQLDRDRKEQDHLKELEHELHIADKKGTHDLLHKKA